MSNALISYNLEEVRKTVDSFYGGKTLKDSEILNVVLQIHEASPEDPVIKLLKGYHDGGKLFRKRADEICGSKTREEEALAELTGGNYIVQSFKMKTTLLNGQLHENREIPLSDDFFLNMKKVTTKIEDKILEVM